MLHTVINALLPVVLTLLLGYIAGWHHDADLRVASVLNNIIMEYALPLALFTGTVATSRATLLGYLPLALTLLLGLMIPYAIVLCVAHFGLRRSLPQSAMWALMMGSPATSFTGLPVLTSVVGSSAAIAVSLAGMVSNLISLPVTQILISSGNKAPDNDGKAAAVQPTVFSLVGKSIAQPIVIAPLLAFVLVLCDIRVPDIITHATYLLGVSSAGISLFASGIILQAQKPKLTWPVTVLSLIRTAAIPALVLFALSQFRVDPSIRRQAVLALGLPAGTIQIMLAVKYCINEGENASLLLFSNIAALFTLGIFIALSA